MKRKARRERERERNIKIDHKVLKPGLGNRRHSVKEQEQSANKRGDNKRDGESRRQLRKERG